MVQLGSRRATSKCGAAMTPWSTTVINSHAPHTGRFPGDASPVNIPLPSTQWQQPLCRAKKKTSGIANCRYLECLFLCSSVCFVEGAPSTIHQRPGSSSTSKSYTPSPLERKRMPPFYNTHPCMSRLGGKRVPTAFPPLV